MVSKRQWTWAAGVLLGATATGMAIAQDGAPRPTIVSQPTSPAAFTGQDAGPAAPASPYFPIARDSVPHDPDKSAIAAAKTSEPAPTSPPALAPVVAPVADEAASSGPQVHVPCFGGGKPSCWDRLRRCVQDCFLGYREEFEAPPLGYYLYLHGQTEVANGDAARLVLYHYDFIDGSEQLKPRGKYQLSKIAALLPQCFNPIIIEMTPDAPGLDEARRVAVVQALATGSFPVPAERVVIGRPIAVPLQGVEATRIYRNLLLNTESGGLRSSAGAGRAGGGGGALGTTSSGVLAPTAAGPSTGAPGY